MCLSCNIFWLQYKSEPELLKRGSLQVNPASIVVVAIHNLYSYPAQAQHAMHQCSQFRR